MVGLILFILSTIVSGFLIYTLWGAHRRNSSNVLDLITKRLFYSVIAWFVLSILGILYNAYIVFK